MTCPVCGTPHSCAHSRTGAALRETAPSPAVEARLRTDQEHWRQEVVTRVRRHRARRRGFDANASLELDFPADAPLMVASAVAEPPVDDGPLGEPTLVEPLAEALADPPPSGVERIAEAPASRYQAITVTPEVRREPRKIIRFPRQAAVDLEAELAELAAPVPETPRILDAPEAEQLELLPSFADIRLEENPRDDLFPAELELASEPAPVHLRLKSGLVDAAIVVVALAMFAAVFNALLGQFAAAAPKGRPVLVFAMASASAIWLLFQYLFLVYGKKTPGMSATGLELTTFEGRRPTYFGRCARAFGATLSGLSLGLGYFWAFVDEHTLGWHDRMSQTYLRSGDRIIG